MVNEKSTKKSTTSSSKNGKTTSSTSTSTSSTSKVSSNKQQSSSSSSTVIEKSGSQTSVHSGVQIAEVTDLQRTDSGASLLTNPGSLGSAVEYVVTTPEMAAAAASRGKEHYIFGGTKITEVGSSTSSSTDFIRHEQEQQTAGLVEDSSTARRFRPGVGGVGHALATVPEVSVFSETTSSSTSSVQQSSTSSVTQTTTDQDGKVDVQSRDWGSSKQRSSADEFHAKSGTGIEPEVRYAEHHSQQKVKFDSGKPGAEPLYERSAQDLERSIEQRGDTNPVEYHKESTDKLKYDHKTGKYLTSQSARENNRVLDRSENIIDSLTLQQEEAIKDAADVINVVHDISDRSARASGTTLRDESSSEFVAKSSSTSSSSTIHKTAATTSDMISSITSDALPQQQQHTLTDQRQTAANIAGVTTTYTSKKWDAKTQSWKVVGESTVTERDVRTPIKSMPAAGVPSKRPQPNSQPAAGVPSSRAVRPHTEQDHTKSSSSSSSNVITSSTSVSSTSNTKSSKLAESSVHESGFRADNLAPKVMITGDDQPPSGLAPHAPARSQSPEKSSGPSSKPATAGPQSPKSAREQAAPPPAGQRHSPASLDQLAGSSTDTIVIESSASTSKSNMQATSQTQVFDAATNTWQTVDQSGVRQSDFQSSMQPPQVIQTTTVIPAAGVPSTTRRRELNTADTNVDIRESVTEVFDTKTQSWKTVDQQRQHHIAPNPSQLPAAGAPSRRKTPETPSTTTTVDKNTEVYDEKTQSWKIYKPTDEKLRPVDLPAAGTPSVVRRTVPSTVTDSISDEKITTSSVSEVFDQKTQTWKVVDQQSSSSVTNQSANTPLPAAGAPSQRRTTPSKQSGPHVDQPSTSVTKTTVTEVFDEKTNTWRVVDDHPTGPSKAPRTLPSDLPAAGAPSRRPTPHARDVNNSVTKTTVSEVFDNKSQTWKIVDLSTTEVDTNTLQPLGEHGSRSGPHDVVPSDSAISLNKFIADERIASASSTLNNSTTTTISKEFDESTKKWKIVDQSTVYERDTTAKAPPMHKPMPAAGAPSRRPSKTDTRTPQSTTTNKNTTDQRYSSTTHVYDERTKTWLTADEKTLKKKRPSIMRYINEAADGTVTTIYKKKMFDRRSGKWRVVEEKVYNNRHAEDHIPEMIDDVTNQTTTTYSTKVFDSRTGTWQVVEEKSFSDTKTEVPRDIVEEIERDHADVANITTTTEITKVGKR